MKNNHNGLAIENKDLHKLLNKYQNNTENYTKLVKSWWQIIDFNKLRSRKVQSNQNDLAVLLKGEQSIRINVNFEMLLEELSRILKIAENQKQQANDRFRLAQELQLLIIIGSMVLSVVLAAVLALYTSRAIANR